MGAETAFEMSAEFSNSFSAAAWEQKLKVQFLQKIQIDRGSSGLVGLVDIPGL